MEFKSVSVIGLGYIGLPTATLLALNGIKVSGVDVVEKVVESVNAGKPHLVEPGLDTLLAEAVRKSMLRASTKAEPADAFIIAVPTPFRDGYQPDLTYIEAAAKTLAPVLRKGNLVILESTSPVGTTEKLAQWLANARPDLTFPQQAGDDADIQVAHCPERVLPGKVVNELVENDRIIGGLSQRATEMARDLYATFVKGALLSTNARTAEMCKLTENSFRDVNIAFANELSLICDQMDIDVWELISLANRHPRVNILQPGCGVGGHCIAVDPWFIVDSAPLLSRLVHTARNVNDYKPRAVEENIKELLDAVAVEKGKKISDIKVACLGLAFKPDIDDLRESPAVAITEAVANMGCQVLAVEPHIDTLPKRLKAGNIRLETLENALAQADILAILVAHRQFRENSNVRNSPLPYVDPVGLRR